MNNKLIGSKLTTTQFYLNTGILFLATIILIKNFLFNKLDNLRSNLLNLISNNYFFNKHLKNLLKIIKQKFIFNTHIKSNFFLNKNDWEKLYIGKPITITGITVGKGTSGNIKKHNFSRGPISHGSKHVRLQGSLGAGTTPGRTLPGKRMAGHLGSNAKKTLITKILLLNPKENFIFIKGPTPGKKKNSLLLY